MLFLYEGSGVRGYPIAAGKPTWRTPIGAFHILTMEEDPVWDVPESIQEEMRAAGKPVLTRVPPSPSNPLGQILVGDKPIRHWNPWDECSQQHLLSSNARLYSIAPREHQGSLWQVTCWCDRPNDL
jgi:hypothetical protein